MRLSTFCGLHRDTEQVVTAQLALLVLAEIAAAVVHSG